MNKLLILITFIMFGCGSTLSQRKIDVYEYCLRGCAEKNINMLQSFAQQKAQYNLCKKLCIKSIK